MQPTTIRTWSSVHTWTSVTCTAFLLMLCVTGLPLIFHDEIESALNPARWQPANPGGPLLSLDEVLAIALAQRPGEVPVFMSFDTERPVVNVTTAPRADSPGSEMHFASFDQTSGGPVPPDDVGRGVMDFLLQLHTDMYLGLPGMLFLGAMGLVFVASVVSGVVLYAPFMQRQPFGVLRVRRSPRVKWLDYHNVLGIVTIAWVLVVGLTGVINTLATPLVNAWKNAELANLTSSKAGPPLATHQGSLDVAVRQARQAAPGMELQFVAFPGGAYSTNQHYAIFLRGNSPLTSHLVRPAMVDAASGELVSMREMPWYMQTLSLSRPLHFGDYGRLPLKLLWATFTIVTIVVLVTGLYLWVVRRRVDQAGPLAIADRSSTVARAQPE